MGPLLFVQLQGRDRGGEGKEVRRKDPGLQKSKEYLTKKMQSRVGDTNQKSHKQRRLFFFERIKDCRFACLLRRNKKIL